MTPSPPTGPGGRSLARRILTPADMTGLAEAAAAAGLRELRPFDPTCEERVVYWERFGLDDTFATVAFERLR